MNYLFNLFNDRKEPVVTVYKKESLYFVKGLNGTQLEYVNTKVDDIETFKLSFNLHHAEELGQVDLFELL
ncbi:hypothetical protein DOS74_03170 [Staphylococcus felis]|uniref:Uncharacterized protein n=1 Tax=Staphylococcus felis TaxID=46127 RepID=A0A3E0IF54_9STAP|nr:hypothetical protein [Staphylococcus felis]REH81363.1 hypothetical protein DOS56_10210 [Staphylococcus felis]REH82329.1 hypothetical protein DOS61_09750 [Staphylococcus felis]REH90219.1 hypothetical protein DOS83_12690 [Staphylococcus felis]REH92858.1 hypothetical protein DOS58_00375 [Staphylococcus felis]REI17872.1 hypothetical protein DOS74_03170 [Staphylococcus felis]